MHKTFAGFSQNDSSQYQRFFAQFLSLYKSLLKPPLQNYYKVLSNKGKFSFNVTDLMLVNALTEISKEKKVTEEEAIDILIEQVYADLRKKYLWVSGLDIYENKKTFVLCIMRTFVLVSIPK